MRVAALYDVHGNLPALEAVLHEVEREGVDVIVFGGDLVAGPQPREVFDRATALGGARFVRGNAERIVVERDSRYDGGWYADLLGEDRLGAMAAWPLTTSLPVDGLGEALFCHATPSADDPIFTRVSPDDVVEKLIGEVDADVVVCGHTHVQFDRRLPKGLRVVNAGSVGMPYEGRRGAFWALLGSGVELRRTEYDVEATVAAVGRVRAPRGEQLAAWLLDPPDPDEASAYFEGEREASHGA